jgi:hypothetical protein
MSEKYTFPLVRDGKTLGMLHWQEGSDQISGDAAAVAAFEEAIKRAIASNYRGSYPPPGLIIINARPAHMKEIISVLDFGRFAIPDCFADHTAAARAKRARENRRRDFFDRMGARWVY